jgi:hypothetical protein
MMLLEYAFDSHMHTDRWVTFASNPRNRIRSVSANKAQSTPVSTQTCVQSGTF